MYAYKDLLELPGLMTLAYPFVLILHQPPLLPDSRVEIDGKEGRDERESIKLIDVSVRVSSSESFSPLYFAVP